MKAHVSQLGSPVRATCLDSWVFQPFRWCAGRLARWMPTGRVTAMAFFLGASAGGAVLPRGAVEPAACVSHSTAGVRPYRYWNGLASSRSAAHSPPSTARRGRHLVVDRSGLPVVVAFSAANAHDSLALHPLIALIPLIRGRRGPWRRRPAKFHRDKGYGSYLRRWLRE